MEKMSLTALAREQLDVARTASSGRNAHTVYGGHEHTLRQTLISITAGRILDEQDNPRDATLYILNVWLRSEGGWPVLAVDADSAGGVFAVRGDVVAGRGLGSLAAVSRGAALSLATVREHAAPLPCGAGVLPGPVGAGEARSVLQVVDGPLARFARSRPDGEAVLVDIGRLPTALTGAPQLLAAADGVVLVAAADREGLGQAAAWLPAAGELAERTAIVSREPAAGGGYSGREIADALGVAVLAGLPEDSRAARSAFTATVPALRGRRSRWWRAVGEVGKHILRLAPAPAASVDSSVAGSFGAVEVRR